MSHPSTSLPQGFESLEPFVPFWAGATSAARADARDSSSEAERQAFYDAIVGLVPQALDYLDSKPLATHNEAEQRLMRLVLSFGHAAMAVELQKEEEGEHAKWRPFMRITTAPADR